MFLAEIKKKKKEKNIAEHHLQTDHRIDWDSAECISFSTDYYQRLTLESWFTNLERTPLNRCQQLPAPYKRLINDKQNKPDKQTNQTNDDQSVSRQQITTRPIEPTKTIYRNLTNNIQKINKLEIRLPQNLAKADLVIYGLFIT